MWSATSGCAFAITEWDWGWHAKRCRSQLQSDWPRSTNSKPAIWPTFHSAPFCGFWGPSGWARIGNNYCLNSPSHPIYIMTKKRKCNELDIQKNEISKSGIMRHDTGSMILAFAANWEHMDGSYGCGLVFYKFRIIYYLCRPKAAISWRHLYFFHLFSISTDSALAASRDFARGGSPLKKRILSFRHFRLPSARRTPLAD